MKPRNCSSETAWMKRALQQVKEWNKFTWFFWYQEHKPVSIILCSLDIRSLLWRIKGKKYSTSTVYRRLRADTLRILQYWINLLFRFFVFLGGTSRLHHSNKSLQKSDVVHSWIQQLFGWQPGYGQSVVCASTGLGLLHRYQAVKVKRTEFWVWIFF